MCSAGLPAGCRVGLLAHAPLDLRRAPALRQSPSSKGNTQGWAMFHRPPRPLFKLDPTVFTNEADMSLDAIEARLIGSDAESVKEQIKIVKSVSMHSVAIFALSVTGREETLNLAGSGTLVCYQDAHYILTALHVWEEGFRRGSKLGISLRTGVYHRFIMDCDTIIPFGLPKPSMWGEAGPDIVLLRIPDVHIGTIKADQVFYNLSITEPAPPNVEHIEASFLIGAPACFGTFLHLQKLATVGLKAFHVGIRQKSGFIEALMNVEGFPSSQSVEGMSGGGLWKVLLYEPSPHGPIESIAILRGVAFWQFPPENNTRVVRCHDIQTIRSLAEGRSARK